jgi:hypothetical protein
MLPISLFPNLMDREKGLHSPTSDDYTDTMSNLNNVTKALASFHLLNQDTLEPGKDQFSWPYGMEGTTRSYQCQIKLMLGRQALTQVCALGPFSKSSLDDKESLVDSNESWTSTTYARFDGPEDRRHSSTMTTSLGGLTLTPTAMSTHPESASCVTKTLPLGALRRHLVSTLPSML